jgi:formate hydrogenlyase subunit 3/multisubunit Na+/H+ antiporter MnhD subunit
MVTAMVILAALCIGLGICFPWIIKGLIEPARDALLQGAAYADRVFGSY